MKYILSFVFALFICTSMSAQTPINSQADWDAIVVSGTVGVSSPVLIQAGVSIVHNGNITFNSQLEILGDLEIASGTFTYSSGTFIGSGTFINNGTTNCQNGLTIIGTSIVNLMQLNVMGAGGGAINSGGSLTNAGTVAWTAAGALAGDGTVTNTGNMDFNPGPLVTNGDIFNCGTINGPPTFTITGPAPDGTPCDAGLVVVAGCDCVNGVIGGEVVVVDPNMAEIPTMSQWGLILLTLLSLSFVMVSVVARQRSLANAKGGVSIKNMTQGSSYPFEKSIFEKALMLVGVLALVAGALTLMAYGSIAAIDFIGTVVCGPILAYFIHLMVLVNQKGND